MGLHHGRNTIIISKPPTHFVVSADLRICACEEQLAIEDEKLSEKFAQEEAEAVGQKADQIYCPPEPLPRAMALKEHTQSVIAAGPY